MTGLTLRRYDAAISLGDGLLVVGSLTLGAPLWAIVLICAGCVVFHPPHRRVLGQVDGTGTGRFHSASLSPLCLADLVGRRSISRRSFCA